MNHSSHQVQIKAIDQALLALFEERARLCRSAEQPATAAIDDMLRRTRGALSATAIRDLFAMLDQSCNQQPGIHSQSTSESQS
jgi:hypothetical protein